MKGRLTVSAALTAVAAALTIAAAVASRLGVGAA